MKKRVAWVVGGVLVLGAVGFALFDGKKPTITLPSFIGASGLEQYVPGAYDQLLYLDIDENLKQVALQSNQFVEDETFVSILDSLEEVIIYQMLDQESLVGYSLIFMKGNDKFTIEQIEAFGVLAGDEGFEHRDLGGNNWVYGESTSLAWLDSQGFGTLNDDAGWEEFDRALKKGSYNAGFLSAAINQDPTNLIASRFAETLQYTYAVSAMRMDKPEGKIVLQLADDTIEGPIDGLDSTIVSSLQGEPVVYIEADDLLSLFSIDEKELATLLPLTIGQWGTSLGVAFDNSDVEAISSALGGNIGIVAMPSLTSPIQLGVHVLFDDENIYGTLEKLAPALKSTLGSMLLTGTGSTIQEVATDTGIAYELTMDLPEIMAGTGSLDEIVAGMPTSFPLFSISNTDGIVGLNIFANQALDLGGSYDGYYDTTGQTKAVFGFDAGLLQQTIAGGLTGIAGDALFATGTLQGGLNIDTDEQQVIVDFMIE